MMQFSNKHSRHSVKSRTTFFMNRSQHNQRVKTLNHHLCTTMGQTVHGSQYNSKTMEQRDATAEFVIRRKLHVLTGQKTVIGNIIMRQHHSFRKTGSARGILHIYHIMAANLALEFVQTIISHIIPQQQNLSRVIHSTMFFLPHIHYILHVRKTLTL